ncbi:MAG: hypothetical protein JRD89_10865 [Deltaproteobacteria bacterium]|nr:hypothetical protein [Deltaproteobacteria bacterium]
MARGLPDYYRGIDIASQTIDKIKADIVAQTVDKLKMDLAAQTIESLDIDVYAQTIAEMIIRGKMGAAGSQWGSVTVPANSTVIPFSLTGKGTLYAVLYVVAAQTNSHHLRFRTLLDGGQIELRPTYHMLYERGFTASTPWQQLLQYAENGICTATLVPPAGATFESSLELELYNGFGVDMSVTWAVAYATV